jgi:hypothetical protein
MIPRHLTVHTHRNLTHLTEELDYDIGMESTISELFWFFRYRDSSVLLSKFVSLVVVIVVAVGTQSGVVGFAVHCALALPAYITGRDLS